MKGHAIYIRQSLLIACLLFLLSVFLLPSRASAATQLERRFDKMSTSEAGVIAIHQIGFVMTDILNPVGSIAIEFCNNTPIPDDVCTLPPGFDAAGVTLTAQTGETGFSVHANTVSNRIVLTRVPINPTGVASTYDLGNILNPANEGTFYARAYTYASTDGTGTSIQAGGIVMYINETITINAEVPPFLRFCVAVSITNFDCNSATEFFIDFGFFNTSSASSKTSQFLVATNAASGYSVTIAGTTLTSGLNTIPALTAPSTSQPGVSQFGMNLRQNTNPPDGENAVGLGTAAPSANYNTPNQFTFNNGDIIASVNHSDNIRKFTVNYLVNISNTQAGGVYTTTLTFICLANF